ncbi:MAG: hypothetical protein IT561_18640, partial [Alphaproteobacteria bacterium]|nr:hypothetical protein [Alphaproteobacteria bacterium]
DLDLRLQDLRAAVAKEIPEGEGFVANPHRTWREVNAKLPAVPIRVALPAEDADSRTFFDERFLVAACRRIPKLRAIFDANERVKKCITLRDDGVIVDLPELHGPAVRAALEAAPRGTVAVLPMAVADELASVVKLLPVDGVPPSPTTIAARSYPFIQPLFVYVKRLHIKDYLGRGAVHGLRELITELTREDTIGPDGYLVPEGLVPMLEARRTAIRDRALRLENMER